MFSCRYLFVFLTPGEIKDYNSDDDMNEDKDHPMILLKKPPLKKKGSVAMDLLVKNLVCCILW